MPSDLRLLRVVFLFSFLLFRYDNEILHASKWGKLKDVKQALKEGHKLR